MVGMKFKIGGKPPEEDAARLRQARELVGDDFLFVVDANQGYTVRRGAGRSCAAIGDLELRWFEEPTRWHADWRGLRDVRLRGNVNVAAGQSEISRVGMREMIVQRGDRRVQLRRLVGRRTDGVARVAALAAVFDVELGHHEEAQLSSHLLASVPHGTFVEAFSPTRDPIFWEMWADRPALVDGQLPLSDAPGFGWELDEAFIARYRVEG